MGKHQLLSELSYSPAKNNNFRTRDPTRHPDPPESAVKPSANKDRKNIMSDAPGTTILMTMCQFQTDVVPVAADFDQVFPKDRIRKILKCLRQACKDAKSEKFPEKTISAGWAEADQSEDGPLCSGYVLHLSEDKAEASDEKRYKVDGSLISDEDSEHIVPDVPNWSLQCLSIEFKRGGTDLNPFDDRSGHNESRSKVRGQLLSYAQQVFLYQHRTALFMIFVNGSHFRAMRWDRAGVIVTETTDYITDLNKTKVLLEILHGFAQLSPQQRGIDLTAVRLAKGSCAWKRMDALAYDQPGDLESTEADFPIDDPAIRDFLEPFDYDRLFQDGVVHIDPATLCNHLGVDEAPPKAIVRPVFKFVRAMFRSSLQKGYPRYQLTVAGRKFLVAKYVFRASGLTGRGTRGYVALEWIMQRFVFLKDTWRPFYVDLDQEGTILVELNELNIPYVPKLICHEDVPHQETETSHYSPLTGEKRAARSPLAKKGPQQGEELRHLNHYRIVVEQVCLSSTAFEDGRQLVKIVYHCVLAHERAYVDNHIIHRDIITGNILVLPVVVTRPDKFKILRHGILTDWELAKRTTSTKALQPYRTGTWPFMSANCLSYPGVAVKISDELESFVHVLLYHAVRFLPHNITDVTGFADAYFDGYIQKDRERVCPPAKRASITNGELTHDDQPIEFHFVEGSRQVGSHPLNDLLSELFKLLQARYEILRWTSMNADDQAATSTLSEPVPAAPTPLYDDDDSEEFAGSAPIRVTQKKQLPDEPSQETNELAQKLDEHEWVRKTLRGDIFGKWWPQNDKTADKLKDYVPREPQPLITKTSALLGTYQSARTGTKRVREEVDVNLEDDAADAPQQKRLNLHTNMSV